MCGGGAGGEGWRLHEWGSQLTTVDSSGELSSASTSASVCLAAVVSLEASTILPLKPPRLFALAASIRGSIRPFAQLRFADGGTKACEATFCALQAH